MWEWIRRWRITGTRSPRRGALSEESALLSAFRGQQKLIESVVTAQQQLIAQQQATLDRIVTARYDRPLERVVHPVQAEPMPAWAMSDQGDVEPATKDPIGAGIAALSVENDADFLEAAN